MGYNGMDIAIIKYLFTCSLVSLLEANMNDMEAKMNDVKAKMHGVEDKMDGLEGKHKGNTKELKTNLTKCLQ